jgi:ribosomal-protein-alanine N-acetyltransferase
MELVPFEDSFVDQVLKWRSAPLTLKYNPIDKLTRTELFERSSKDRNNLDNLDDSNQVRLYAKVGEQIVGTVSLSGFNPKMFTAEIGYMVDEDFYGKGYATQMVKIFIKNIFTKTAIRKLIASIHEDNKASRRMVEKIGFILEGTLREHYLIDGIAINEAVYGILKREFSL